MNLIYLLKAEIDNLETINQDKPNAITRQVIAGLKAQLTKAEIHLSLNYGGQREN